MKDEDRLIALVEGFHRRDRMALAKIITLVESTTAQTRTNADFVLTRLAPREKNVVRIAVSGPPGVGKSTFINVLGTKLIAKNLRLAVLPIDPSSDTHQGSILADKTRMKDLINHDDVYIRPSPSKGALGGIALTTHDVLFVVESFGFDVVIIETVGVGQSEMLAHRLADHFVLLAQPGSGDQLQAMKMGIVEKANFILVNKTDGEQEDIAKKTLTSLKGNSANGAMVMGISALKDIGIDQFLTALFAQHDHLNASGELSRRRIGNLGLLFEQTLAHVLTRRLCTMPLVKNKAVTATKNLGIGYAPMGQQIENIVDELCQKLQA